MEYTTKADEYKRLLPELENKEEVSSQEAEHYYLVKG